METPTAYEHLVSLFVSVSVINLYKFINFVQS